MLFANMLLIFWHKSHLTKFMNIYVHGRPLITNIKDLPHNDARGKTSPTNFTM
jgi:hypothetical protein